MAEQDGTTENTEETTEEVTEETTESTEETTEEVPADVLRANLTRANQDAARYRTRLREVEQALAERKTDEDIESLLNGLRETHAAETRALLVEAVASKFNLPDALAARLNGSTREELEKDAEALAAFAPKSEDESTEVPPGDLDGGLNPGSDNSGDDDDPRARVRKLKGYR